MSPGILTNLALALILGTAFALGVLLLLSVTPRVSALSLSRRIAPYLRDITDPKGLTPDFGAPIRDIRSLWRRAQAIAAHRMGGSAAIERRLIQAGWSLEVVGFRGRQLVWAIAGLAVGGILIVAVVLAGRTSPVMVLLPPLCAVSGIVLYEMRLSAAARARVHRVQSELPTVLEFLALCLSAGEGIFDSLRRVSELVGGELAAEFRTLIVAVRTGAVLSEELLRMAERIDLPALSRAVDQLSAAIERGAPLAHVLHAQALDAREDAKRTLIEQAGRKEIYMLIPLVFLVLPLSVVFAVYPGIFILRLGVG